MPSISLLADAVRPVNAAFISPTRDSFPVGAMGIPFFLEIPMLHLKNLYVASNKAFKVGVTPSGQVLTKKEAEAEDGTLVVSGNARKIGTVTMQISQVDGARLVAIQNLSRELQVQLLARVLEAIRRAHLGVVFLYDAAFRRACLRSKLAVDHRLQTLPQEIDACRRKATGQTMSHFGARVSVLPA